MSTQLNTKIFISKAHKVHGLKYDYSKAKYINAKTPVIIICKKHGEFIQTPNNHTQGNGCKTCGNVSKGLKKKISKENFVDKAKRLHKNKYDYIKVEYINAKTKVIITCKKHGEFKITPNNHLSGRGCQDCGRHNLSKSRQQSPIEFITKAKNIHKNFYNYSKTNYKDSSTKIIIICPIHGEFEQTPNNHLKNRTCPKCADKIRREKRTLPFQNFINEVKSIHGDRYKYDESSYKNRNSNLKIICPKHGEFLQTPKAHLKGCGCPTCGYIKTAEKLSMTSNEFLSRAFTMHNDTYDYSRVRLENSTSKVQIKCKTHGYFFQYPLMHLRGHGCRECGDETKVVHLRPEDAKIARRMRSRIGQAIKKNFKHGIGVKYLGISISEYKNYLESQFEPWMNWDNWRHHHDSEKSWHIDHIKPISTFDLSTEEGIKAAFNWRNTIPLDSFENMSKGAKWKEKKEKK